MHVLYVICSERDYFQNGRYVTKEDERSVLEKLRDIYGALASDKENEFPDVPSEGSQGKESSTVRNFQNVVNDIVVGFPPFIEVTDPSKETIWPLFQRKIAGTDEITYYRYEYDDFIQDVAFTLLDQVFGVKPLLYMKDGQQLRRVVDDRAYKELTFITKPTPADPGNYNFVIRLPTLKSR